MVVFKGNGVVNGESYFFKEIDDSNRIVVFPVKKKKKKRGWFFVLFWCVVYKRMIVESLEA